MPDIDNNATDSASESLPSHSAYYATLMGAYDELQSVKAKKRELTIRETQLTRTVNALFPLVFGEVTDVNSLSLPSAIRLVIDGADRPLSANDMKTKLEDLGFDFKRHENPIANILTAMRRMSDSGELIYVSGDKKQVSAGPNLKPRPEISSGDYEGQIAEMLRQGAMVEGGLFTPPAEAEPENEKV